MTRDHIIETLRDLLQEAHPEVDTAYLFGSVARGEVRASSDIDVAVLFRKTPPPTLDGLGASLRIQDDAEAKLGQPVDVVVLNTAPLDLIHRVLRDGVILIDRDSIQRVRFEARSCLAYLDFLPVLRLYRRPRGTQS